MAAFVPHIQGYLIDFIYNLICVVFSEPAWLLPQHLVKTMKAQEMSLKYFKFNFSTLSSYSLIVNTCVDWVTLLGVYLSGQVRQFNFKFCTFSTSDQATFVRPSTLTTSGTAPGLRR